MTGLQLCLAGQLQFNIQYNDIMPDVSIVDQDLEQDLEVVPQEIVIARVIDPTGNNHFVLVTGEKWNGTRCDFTISDPGFSKTFLSQYPSPSELVVIQRSGGLN